MSVHLTQEQQDDIFKTYGGNAKNTGSIEGQVALFTKRIQILSDHLKENRKDHACRRTLLSLVGKRKRLLNYLAKKDITKYRSLIEQLGIRNVRK